MTEDARELAERLAFYVELESRLSAASSRNDTLRVFAGFSIFAGICGLVGPYHWLIIPGIVGGVWLALDHSSRRASDSQLSHAREMVRRTRQQLGHKFDS